MCFVVHAASFCVMRHEELVACIQNTAEAPGADQKCETPRGCRALEATFAELQQIINRSSFLPAPLTAAP